ncbi:MAG: pyridoxal-phosphate-dependent aminotransferase family protein [Solirubrobacteraceae bacterium]
MSAENGHVPGFQFLQTPGPTNVPGRVLRAMSAPTIDHRGPAFAELTHTIQEGLRSLLATSQHVVMFAGSGTGGWEAALVNTLAPGARVLAFDTGHFARTWSEVATRLGFDVELVAGDWGRGVDPAVVESILSADPSHTFAATLIVHGETSTGVIADLPACRAAIDAAGHPCLLLVDIVSSLGASGYLHDEWGVDVAVGASQKGLLLPPGLAFNAVSERALKASRECESARSYWDWGAVIAANEAGMFPATPPTNLMFGLLEALAMLEEESMTAVLARHQRHAAATRAAVAAWGLETVCTAPDRYHPGLTAVRLPAAFDERDVRSAIRERYGVSLGGGLGPLAGSVFRIGHLGDFNDAMLIGVLGAVELGLRQAGVECPGGVGAAMDALR